MRTIATMVDPSYQTVKVTAPTLPHFAKEQPDISKSTKPPLGHPSPNRQRKRRSVLFNPVVKNRRITHLNDISEEEKEATWISPDSYAAIKKRCMVTVKKMMRNQLTQEDLQSELHSTRGLEGKTRQGAQRRRENKLDAISAVMEEQNLQWGEEVDDQEAITEVYCVYSYPCSQSAHQVGLDDHAAVQDYLFKNETTLSGTNAPPTFQGGGSTATGQSVASAPRALVDKLKDIIDWRRNRAALLQEIEKNFYEESSIQRRPVRRSMSKEPSSLASQLRDYFKLSPSRRELKKTPLCIPAKDLDSIPNLESLSAASHIEQDSSDEERSQNSSFSDIFSSQLQGIFYSRQRRHALLDEIEHGYHVEQPSITTITTKPAR
jgi:hypothetical protein